MVSDGVESCFFYGGQGGQGGRRGFGCLLTLPLWNPAGGAAVLVACLPFYFSLFSAPIPPTPFPAGRGDLRVFYARGSAPCIPGAERGAALVFPVESRFRRWACPVGRLLTLPLWYPAGGLAFFVARLPFYFSLFSAPIPPTPFPSGEGGDLRLFYARGFAPCIPGAVPGRHWRNYGQPFAFALAANRRLPDVGHLYGCLCKCRKRLGAGVPGAEPPAK